MALWLREAALQVGASVYRLGELDFSFKVTMEDGDKLPSCTCEIKNLSQDHRRSIQKGNLLIVNAGYEGDMGVLFAGEITSFYHSKAATEWVSSVLASPIAGRWLSAKINKTYRAGFASDILKDLLRVFGVEVSQFSLKEDKRYPRGKVCRGKLKDVLQEIVVKDCRSRFTIRNQSVFISAGASAANASQVLSESTGLLSAKSSKSELQVSGSTEDSAPKTDKVECLLNYHLSSGDLVSIQCASLNGTYRIIRGKHEGSLSGAYKTSLEVTHV